MPRIGLRAIRVVLVFVLSLSVSIQSSRAMLPEIVVGGTVLFQAAQVLTDLLPQLATLGASLVGLANASKEAGSTLSKLFGHVFPQNQASKPKKDIGPIDVPTITGPTDAAPTDSAPPTEETTAELDAHLSQLVTSYRERTQPRSLSYKASATRGAETSYETASDQTTISLIETIRAGDKKALERFVSAVKRLPAEDRPAVSPVLQAAVTKGARFARVHGDAAATAGFAKLKSLHDALK